MIRLWPMVRTRENDCSPLGGIMDHFPEDRCTPRVTDFGCIDGMRHHRDNDVTT